MIKILNYSKNPISHIGKVAGTCYGTDTTNQEKNFKRGLGCINDGHGRTMEYADVEMIIDGYSARVIRELGRHCVGTTYLQESTRYCNCKDFNYYTPTSIKNNEFAKVLYDEIMEQIGNTYEKLTTIGIPKEDVANILPLGMSTKIVYRINLRALVNLFNVRLCNRAYIEFREMLHEIKQELLKLDDEWKYICNNLLIPKCEAMGYCEEHKSCGRKPKKQDVIKK